MLAVTAVALGSIAEAREKAYVAVRCIQFSGCFYRKDIAACPAGIDSSSSDASANGGRKGSKSVQQDVATYLDAGVDVHLDEAVAASTRPLMSRLLD